VGGCLVLGRTSPDSRFEVDFFEPDGCVRGELLSSCWMVPFEAAPPVRKFGSYRGKRSFSGLWWSCTISDHVGFESWLERDRVMALDFDPAVVGLSSQPFRLSWQVNGKIRSHTPDYFVRLRDGTGVVVDVRADDRIEPEDAEVFAATAQACESVGWEFRRVGAMDVVRTANLRWLAGYRHPRCLHAGWASDLRRVFRDSVPLLAGARLVGDPIAVLPTLFHLLWRHVLEADLDSASLSASSMVWCRAGEGA
jgi:hypothetical protein